MVNKWSSFWWQFKSRVVKSAHIVKFWWCLKSHSLESLETYKSNCCSEMLSWRRSVRFTYKCKSIGRKYGKLECNYNRILRVSIVSFVLSSYRIYLNRVAIFLVVFRVFRSLSNDRFLKMTVNELYIYVQPLRVS